MQIKNQKEQEFKFRCYKLTLRVMALIETEELAKIIAASVLTMKNRK